MAKRKAQDGDIIIIKKYANRRLYNTGTSSYITLDDLSAMTRDGVEFKVIDAKSGEEITHSILTQIIMEEEAGGNQMLPLSFLRDLIGMYGNSMSAMMPSYLEAMMGNFRQNQSKIAEAFKAGAGKNPIAAVHETNMALMRAAADVMMPGNKPRTPQGKQAADAAAPSESDEIAELRAQMKAMQAKLDRLSK
ncbi:uncharacterized protein HME9302_01145 [Alteripontixanthobacter maritimus]|uniref:Polyhydroxyalkanoate synthesis repressor PhaR n=1 Tax=Alteripontixanthobacter maritimus TaxID=2161824 RepID=A0A369QCE8_9SPHN|nr:polyhydroxyalkanoate synthesis repressor PhaR [Alteripontixanthobacter maritimus]RDC59948.1 uncharacterized protein HME9302_01145 [Alteripontixanthobacter maritimus]